MKKNAFKSFIIDFTVKQRRGEIYIVTHRCLLHRRVLHLQCLDSVAWFNFRMPIIGKVVRFAKHNHEYLGEFQSYFYILVGDWWLKPEVKNLLRRFLSYG